jgi:hypothetical protein
MIALELERDIDLGSAPLRVDGSRRFGLRLAHRNQANAAGAKLNVELQLFDGSSQYFADPVEIDLAPATPGVAWAERSAAFSASGSRGARITRMILMLTVRLPHEQRGVPVPGVAGFLDLDSIELVDSQTGQALVPADVGGFEVATHHQTHVGDWAANAIDRLGGIAWWGSSSDGLTSGFGFAYSNRFLRNFLAGRTLGEAILASGKAESGLIYGDPLYRPVAAALYLPAELEIKGSGSNTGQIDTPGLVVTRANVNDFRTLFMSVLHGTSVARSNGVNWALSTCPGLDPAVCTRKRQWSASPVMGGRGSVKERAIDWLQFIDPNLNQKLTIRLKVWNDGEEANALYDFASFDYQAAPATPP